MTITALRIRVALAAVVCVTSTPSMVSAAPYAVASQHRAPSAMLHALRVYVIGRYGDRLPVDEYNQHCTWVTDRRWNCDWEVNGNGAPGDYRNEVDGSAKVSLHGRRWRVRHVVVFCAPDGRHDVCPSAPSPDY